MSKSKRLGRGLDTLLSNIAAANEANDVGVVEGELDDNLKENFTRGILAVNQTGETTESLLRRNSRRSDAAELEAQKDEALASFSDGRVAKEIDVNLIDANPYQPRLDFDKEELAELKESLAQHGMLQPIVLRQKGGRYEVVAGERRLRAAVEAGWKRAPAIIITVDDRQMAELALTENMQRRDLNPLEKATAFRNYLNLYGGTHEELATRLALDRSTVTNLMRLLELDEEVQEMTRRGIITQGHARALLPLEEWDQREMARRIASEQLSVRQTEAIVREYLANGALPAKPIRKMEVSPQVKELENQIRSWLGMKIKLTANDKGKGKLVIHFNSNNDFERIYQAFKPQD